MTSLADGHYVNGAFLDLDGEYGEFEGGKEEALAALQDGRATQCDDPQCGMVHLVSTTVELDEEHDLDDCPDRGSCPTHSLCNGCGQYPCRCDDMYEAMKERRLYDD